jgi:hypothetical protein
MLLPFTSIHPEIHIPEFRSIGLDRMPIAHLARHMTGTGETGSGKTQSIALPLLRGLIRYPEEPAYAAYAAAAGPNPEPLEHLRPALLIVDGKGELGPYVRQLAPNRVIHDIRFPRPERVLHLFEGRDAKRLDVFEITDSILALSRYYTLETLNSRDPYWIGTGADLIREQLGVDLTLERAGKREEFWDQLSQSSATIKPDGLKACRENYMQPFAALLGLPSSDLELLGEYHELALKFGIPEHQLIRTRSYIGLSHHAQATAACVQSVVSRILAEVSSPELANMVSVNPFQPPPAKRWLSINKAMRDGEIILCTPGEGDPIADLAAMALKSLYFRMTFQKPLPARPVVYLVDEAQRFITDGELDGEQNWLDRARAYRGIGILLSQSISSLRYRLATLGNDQLSHHALQIMLTNCGTQFYFRTTDLEVNDRLIRLLPGPPQRELPHIVQMRPPSGLPTGHCYYIKPGGWGRGPVLLDPSPSPAPPLGSPAQS